MTPSSPAVDIVLPALNESAAIRATITSLVNELPHARIIFIDNGSTDGTQHLARELLQSLECEYLILHVPERGKGNAVRAGFAHADADVVVMIDADHTYPANRIHDLIRPVLNGEADMVIGDRRSSGSYRTENTRRFHGVGNQLIQKLVNLSFRTTLHDVLSGYRALSKTFVRNYPVMVSGFEIETDMTIHALDKRFRILEVPVSIQNRPDGSASKLRTTRDGVRVLRTLLDLFRMYRPLEFFGGLSVVSLIGSCLAGAVPIYDYIVDQYVHHVPLAVLAVGAFMAFLLLFSLGLILSGLADQARRQFELHKLSVLRVTTFSRSTDGKPAHELDSP